MRASFVDRRKTTSEIIKALHRKERVTVLYCGKPAAIMQPIDDQGVASVCKAKDHGAFGIWADRHATKDVAAYVRELRRSRFNAL